MSGNTIYTLNNIIYKEVRTGGHQSGFGKEMQTT